MLPCQRDGILDRHAPVLGRIAEDVAVDACSKAGVGVTHVSRDLCHRAALVDKERCTRVSEVVGAEVRFTSALKRRDPDALPPVLPTKMSSFGVRENERARVRPAARKVQLAELRGDRTEELGLPAVGAFRRYDLTFGESARDAQPRAGETALVKEVAPLERERLARAYALVCEQAHERRIGSA